MLLDTCRLQPADLQEQDNLWYLFLPDALLRALERLLFCAHEPRENVAQIDARLKHPQYPPTCFVKTLVFACFLLTDCS